MSKRTREEVNFGSSYTTTTTTCTSTSPSKTDTTSLTETEIQQQQQSLSSSSPLSGSKISKELLFDHRNCTNQNMTTTTGQTGTTTRSRTITKQYPPLRRLSFTNFLRRSTPFGNETGTLACGEFEPIVSTTNSFSKKVLVVGAGGLGCEILKNLGMSHIIREVHVIDLDTIDITNLNRQFLFRATDVGCSKAVTAAKFMERKCPWMKVIPHHGKIQDKDPGFYQQFDCIISGLDNIEARRWLNATIVGLVDCDEDGSLDYETIIPIFDGGTEAFAGQARIILPKITSCFECTLELFPPQLNTFPLCTIAETPRKPEHCIMYAYLLEWNRFHDDEHKVNTDSPDDMQWIYQKALERAEQYNILGVTYTLTLGVVKNIIPAVASTNAIVAAICVNEAMKYLTYYSQNLNTYMMYMGSDGIYSPTLVHEKKDDCMVCSTTVQTVTLPSQNRTTVNELIQYLKEEVRFRLTSPSVVTSSGKTLYMPKPPALELATRPNLHQPLSTLLNHIDEEIVVTDPLLESISLILRVQYTSCTD